MLIDGYLSSRWSIHCAQLYSSYKIYQLIIVLIPKEKNYVLLLIVSIMSRYSLMISLLWHWTCRGAWCVLLLAWSRLKATFLESRLRRNQNYCVGPIFCSFEPQEVVGPGTYKHTPNMYLWFTCNTWNLSSFKNLHNTHCLYHKIKHFFLSNLSCSIFH